MPHEALREVWLFSPNIRFYFVYGTKTLVRLFFAQYAVKSTLACKFNIDKMRVLVDRICHYLPGGQLILQYPMPTV